MTRYLLPCLVVTCFIWAHGHCADVPKEDHTKSPHTEALDVVFATQQKIIAAVDTEIWWHDVKERQWLVKRPFSPGVIDSTHLFDVTYRVDGKDVAAWFVDTRKKSAERREVAGAKKEQ